MKPAIRVDNLSKVYRLGHRSADSYQTLRDSLVRASGKLMNRFRRGPSPEPEVADFWALKDISFEVNPGDVVGIIGRNGAGKSTLLKILSRIVEPTTGRAEIHGRMGSLLEVGTGFHPELTGRENIYLNGAILGMKRQEIDRKFDEIVAFSEIEQFLDTPVKRYSSGMYVRLAFAVAAHLEPEILIVDEVLAVGDAAFQKKCVERIKELGASGRTILFVSHNMGIVSSICDRAITIAQGRLLNIGPAREQIQKYIASLKNQSNDDIGARRDRTGNGAVLVTGIRLLDSTGHQIDSPLVGEPLKIQFDYEAKAPLGNLEIHAWICSGDGVNVTILSSRYTGDLFRQLPAKGCLECSIPELCLAPAHYLINVCLDSGLDMADYILGAASFDVQPGPFFRTGRTPPSEHGMCLSRNMWSFNPAG